MRTNGWDGSSDAKTGMAFLEVTKKDGTQETLWNFPVTYSDNKYSLVLDAMMSAKTQAVLDSQKDEGIKSALEKSSSTSMYVPTPTVIISLACVPTTCYSKTTTALIASVNSRNKNHNKTIGSWKPHTAFSMTRFR